MTRSCAECLHGRGHYGSLRCLREQPDPTRNDIAGAPYCADERRGGLLSWIAGACGPRGWHFVPRARGGMVSVESVRCDGCGHVGPVVLADGDWECAACGREVTT